MFRSQHELSRNYSGADVYTALAGALCGPLNGEANEVGCRVYGMEYWFGAHDYSISGVFEVEPRSCPGFMYRCSISLGHLDISVSEFTKFIKTMASDYHGHTYHLISKNCNHFTANITQRLTTQRIHGWMNCSFSNHPQVSDIDLHIIRYC